jgi:hypothetical protein
MPHNKLHYLRILLAIELAAALALIILRERLPHIEDEE